MIMGYTLPGADENIVAGIKIHTLRLDRKNRWQAGREIHHSKGVRSKDYRCFLQNKCTATQQALIVLLEEPGTGKKYLSVTIDRRRLTRDEVAKFAVNDGFKDEAGMIAWFFSDPKITLWGGKVIHWTKFKY